MKPGEFRASCRLVKPVPLGEISESMRASVEAGNVPTRWDRKLKAEVVDVPCVLDTTDRGVFEAHMKEQHDGGIYRWDNGSLAEIREVRNYRPRMPLPVKLWKPARLSPDGKPWVDPDKKHPLTETCACGLVLELGSDEASRLFVRQHLELCAGQAVAS